LGTSGPNISTFASKNPEAFLKTGEKRGKAGSYTIVAPEGATVADLVNG